MSDSLDASMLELIEESWSFNREKLSAIAYEHLLQRRLYNELYQDSRLAQLDAVFPDLEGRLLDFGCGEGGLTITLRRKGIETFGVDIRGRSLRIAKLRAGRYGLPSSIFIEYDGQKLPFGSGTFEYVASMHVFEHVDDHLNYLREAKRVLKPDGRIFLGFPNAIFPLEPHVNLWFFHWLPGGLRTPILKAFRPMHVAFMVANQGAVTYPLWTTPGRALKMIREVFPNARFATDELWSQKMQGRLGSTGMRLVQKLKPILDSKVGVLLYRYLGRQIAIVASR